MLDVLALQTQFAIPGHLDIHPGPNGLPVAEIHNQHARATVCLYGGQVLAFQPHGQAPVLWMSAKSNYEAGKAIRGGIPVCWPWFGAHPSRPELPMHGLARLMYWQVLGTEVAPGGATRLRLVLRSGDCTRTSFAGEFELELVVTVSAELRVELITRNTGSEPFTISAALHSYFTVGDARQIVIHGLEGKEYLTKIGTPGRYPQVGPITITQETDRVYFKTAEEVTIEDPVYRRRIVVAKTGSRSTVVWNPWIEKSAKMPDFGDTEYQGMVCVESCNALDDSITLPAGEVHRLQTHHRVLPL